MVSFKTFTTKNETLKYIQISHDNFITLQLNNCRIYNLTKKIANHLKNLNQKQ